MFGNKKDFVKSCTMITACAVFITTAWLSNSCEKETVVHHYQTENVFVIVVDGARYTETWGEQNRALIPYRSALLKQGVLCDQFYTMLLPKPVKDTKPCVPEFMKTSTIQVCKIRATRVFFSIG